jgi:hypothetical protein
MLKTSDGFDQSTDDLFQPSEDLKTPQIDLKTRLIDFEQPLIDFQQPQDEFEQPQDEKFFNQKSPEYFDNNDQTKQGPDNVSSFIMIFFIDIKSFSINIFFSIYFLKILFCLSLFRSLQKFGGLLLNEQEMYHMRASVSNTGNTETGFPVFGTFQYRQIPAKFCRYYNV